MKLTKAIWGFEIYLNSSGYSLITIDNYKRILMVVAEYMGDPELNGITKQDIQSYMIHTRERKLASASRQTHWKAIRSFYNWAAEELNIKRPDDIPAPDYENKPIIPFTEEEIKKLLIACTYTQDAKTEKRKGFKMLRPSAKRDKALILFLLDSGLRVGEVSRVCIKHVDLNTGNVTVNPHESGKKSHGRVVHIGHSTKKVVWSYLVTREIMDTDALFLSRNGIPMHRNSIRHLVSGLGDKAGIPNVFPHRFRHTFAIQYLRNGGDVFTLQRLLGHSSLEMVKRYLAIAQADTEQAHRKASPVDNWKL